MKFKLFILSCLLSLSACADHVNIASNKSGDLAVYPSVSATVGGIEPTVPVEPQSTRATVLLDEILITPSEEESLKAPVKQNYIPYDEYITYLENLNLQGYYSGVYSQLGFETYIFSDGEPATMTIPGILGSRMATEGAASLYNYVYGTSYDTVPPEAFQTLFDISRTSVRCKQPELYSCIGYDYAYYYYSDDEVTLILYMEGTPPSYFVSPKV